jgi:CRISPR-associated protein Cst2
MNNVVLATGLILIDAPASALNNAGIERGRMDNNKVVVKKIRLRGREEYPYVSGQAFKRWWRESLHDNFNWKESPISREEKVAYTEANPIKYEEDDLFGYMLAPSKKEGKGLVYRRVAPLKCTPLISVFSNVITDDFGVFSRGPAEKEPVPFEQEFYSTILKGAFSLMANEIGVFQRGISLDIPAKVDVEKKEEKGREVFDKKMSDMLQLASEKKATIDDNCIRLTLEERRERIKQTLLALSALDGGAKKSTYLTDVSPKFVIAAVLNIANHVFMDSLKAGDGKITVNVDVIKEIVKDYGKNFLSPIFIGLRKGFLEDSHYEELSKLKLDSDKLSIDFGTPKETIAKLAEHTIRVCT